MPQHMDHYQISSRNLYESAHKLREQTGLGFYDGGFFAGNGMANKIFPLGKGTFIEINGIVDPGKVVAKVPGTMKFYDRTEAGDCFSLMCMRTDTIEELQAIAKRLGSTVSVNPVQRTRPNGPPVQAYTAPQGAQRGPNKMTWYCHESRQYMHPSGQPVFNWPNCVEPLGIAYLEFGGTAEAMTEWIGEPVSNFPAYKFFPDRPEGLYAIGVNTSKGVKEIRLPWRV